MKHVGLTLAAVFAALVTFAGLAFAGIGTSPGVTDSALESVAVAMVSVLAAVLTFLAPRLAAKAAGWFEDRTRIDVPAAVLAQADALATRAVAYAEEQGRKQAKRLGDVPLPGKLETAVAFFVDFAIDHGVLDWTEDKIERFLEARLHLERRAEIDTAALADVLRELRAAEAPSA